MGFGRFARIICAAALVGGLVVAAGPALATSPAGPAGPGCDATRTASAYYSGGAAAVTTQAAQPCLVATGFGGAETQVVSLDSGALVYEPAILTPGLAGTGFLPGVPGPAPSTQLSPGGLALSGYSGASWSFVEPAGATWVPQDDALYVDRTTGWLFYYALAANPVPAAGQVPLQDQVPAGEAHLMVSPDRGRTWNETGLPGFVESENPRFTSAPPFPGDALPAGGYADVTYWCGNDAVNLGQPLPGYRACYRSLDGGASWQYASMLASGPAPQHRQCGTNAETFADLDPNYPEGAPDGSLYAEVTCGGVTYLARSTDEAASWPLVTSAGKPVTLPADGELRVDGKGNLYLVYLTGQSTLDLRVSRNGGLSWGAPLDMTPPGAAHGNVVQWAVAERGDGEVAASYLVQRGTSALYDGYLSVTFDALGADPPVFLGAALNAPSNPLRTSAPASARDDYIGVDITPGGTPWAAFAASCPGPVPGSPACAGQAGNSEANEAVAGRLAFL